MMVRLANESNNAGTFGQIMIGIELNTGRIIQYLI
jgi:hypothetical protein